MTTASTRTVGGIGWNIWRAFIGIAYLAAAVFNTVYTLPRSDQLDGYADGAWFPFLGDFMRDVFMPNGDLFMILVIAFEVAVAVLILGRGSSVDAGVVASVLWVLAVLPFLAWPYLITNLVLALTQGVILFRRYDTAIWEPITNRFGSNQTTALEPIGSSSEGNSDEESIGAAPSSRSG
ncbi:MAG: hypothetical protein HKN95_02735 [Acidimicrobiia bacterium]|nr:hypothetical protein [Acidimicrobiia bacterium]